MGRSIFETILGAVVIAIAATFLAFAYNRSDVKTGSGYKVSANFPMVDGLKDGLDVRINGVKVGTVLGMHLITKPGPDQFLVRVGMTVNNDIKLPTDTMALIATESLLGGKYMSLEPGVDDEDIATDGGGRITRTQAPMRLDDLIGQMIYGSKRGDTTAAPTAAAAPAVAPAHP